MNNAHSKLLTVENLSMALSSPSVDFLQDVNLSVDRGETLCVVGESGCGKSITALALMGLLPEVLSRKIEGEMSFLGKRLSLRDVDSLQEMRGDRIAMIFQEPMTSLNPAFRIGDQVVEAWKWRHGSGGRDQALKILEKVGIPDPASRMNEYPHQLSGGMRQRVMIAIALINKPDLLIADEPTTALDVTVQSQILNLINDLQKDRDMGVIMITHDLGVVAQIATNVLVMYSGQVVEQGSVHEIFNNPQHPYTIGLIASVPPISGPRKRLAVIPGRVPLPNGIKSGCRFADRCPFSTDVCEHPPPLNLAQRGHLVRCHHAPIENMTWRCA